MMKSVFKYTAVILIAGLFFFTCCGKENRGGWLVVDIHAHDALTGAPVKARVCLCYQQYTMFGSYASDPVDFGTTDDNGYLHIEWKVPRKAKNFKISVNAGYKYNWPGGISVITDCENSQGTAVSSGHLNEINPEFYPFGRYRLHCVNQSCFDEFDSLVLTIGIENNYSTSTLNHKINGCADTILPGQTGHYDCFYTEDDEIEIEKHIYKNGSHSISYQNVIMEKGDSIQVIEIVY